MKRLLSAVVAFALFVSEANAQWQVPTNAVPYGRGTGTGFSFAAAGALGHALIANGASGPTFQGFLQVGTGATTRTWQSKAADIYSSKDFGAVGNGVANDTAALQAAATAAASRAAKVWMPYGSYLATAVPTGGMIWGDGQISVGGVAVAGVFSDIQTMPTTPVSSSDMFGGDHSHVWAPEQFIIRPGVARATTTSNYYQWTLYPHVGKLNVDSGSSGTAGWLGATASAGATSITANASGVVANGQTFIVSPDTGSAETRTATTVVGTTINFAVALANTHTVTGGLPPPRILTSNRTMSVYDFRELQNSTGGDHYNYLSRINSCSYTPTAGQAHFFYTATCGSIGGETNAGTAGVYLQNTEWLMADNGNDVAGLGHVSNYNRTNTTGARGAVWGHDFANSYDQRLEWGYNLLGGYKRFADFSRATLDADNAAISLPNNARTYYGATATTDVGGYGFYGNVLSDTWLSGVDGVSGAFTFMVNGTGNFIIGPRNNAHIVDFDGLMVHTIQNTSAGTSAAGALSLGTSSNPGLGRVQINGPSTATYGGANSLNVIQTANVPLALATNDTVRMTVSGAGAYRFHTLGAGAMQTDASGNVSSGTLPIASVSGLGTGVATFLATPSSANLAAAVTDETGSAGTLPFQSTGSWTPTITFATPGDFAVTYSTQVGSYIRTGNMMTVTFNMLTSSFTHTTASGDLIMGTLPCTARNTSDDRWRGTMQFGGITKAGYTNYTVGPTANTTNAIFVASGSGSVISTVKAADMPTGGAPIIQGSVTYICS